jgi:hypothetical protein
VLAILTRTTLSGFLISTAVLLAKLTVFAQAPPAPATNGAKIVAEFQQRAKQYLEWRERTAGTTPPPTNSPEQIDASRHSLADKVRVGRAGAKQGELFTPEITHYFRHQIAATLNGPSGKQIRSSLRHSEPTEMELQINQSYPEKVPLQSTPPTLLLNLPELPKGLEYRILGRELVLRDSDANIVVDYIPNALPAKLK